ncbi:hypothetical protein ACHAXT_008642 [Thalassiosira profunda]
MPSAILVVCNFVSSAREKKQRNSRRTAFMNGSGGSAKGSSANGRAGRHALASGDPNALLPYYLQPIVRHYHDDFWVSRSFDPRLIVQLMAEGFLPIATSGYLLPKLHIERCVLRLNPASELHISRSTRKKCKRFLLSVNEAFDRVVVGCHRQHGTNWLYPQIVDAFRTIHKRTSEGNAGGFNATIIDEETQQPGDYTPVRLYSIEIWNAKTGALAGGELGYSVGGVYSSLTGFSDEDAAGSCQLVALGKLLERCGFEYWDLGMDLDYKRRLGATIAQRTEFLGIVKRSRIENKGTVLQCGGERRNAKDLVDWEQPSSAATANGDAAKKADGGRKKPHPSSESNNKEKADGQPSHEQNRKRVHEQNGDSEEEHEHKVGKGAAPAGP